MATTSPTTVLASAAQTVTFTTAAISAETATVALLINVSAASGTTPTLDCTVEWSNDATTWAVSDVADSFVQITVAKVTSKAFASKGLFFRIRGTVAGTTPSFTTGITATFR